VFIFIFCLDTIKNYFILLFFFQERAVGAVSPVTVFTSQNAILSFTCNYETDINWFFRRDHLNPVSPPFSFKSKITIVIKHPGFLYCYGLQRNRHYVDRVFIDVKSKQK